MKNLVRGFYGAVFRGCECRDGFEDVCCRGGLDVLSSGGFDSFSGGGSFSGGRVSSSRSAARGRCYLRRGSSIGVTGHSGLDSFVITVVGYEVIYQDTVFRGSTTCYIL